MSIFALYVDPTAAGVGIQMLLGAVVGGLVVIKLYWARVFSLFRKSKRETEETPATSEESREAMGKEDRLHR